MKYIKTYEAVNGHEVTVPFSPAFDRPPLPKINKGDMHVILCRLDDKFYHFDEYQNLYNEYLTMGGTPLDGGSGGFTEDNLEAVLTLINNLDTDYIGQEDNK